MGGGKEGEKKGEIIMCPRCLVIFELNILAIFAESYVFLHFRGSSEWLSNLPKVTQLVIEEPNSDRSIWLQSLCLHFPPLHSITLSCHSHTA